MADEVDKIEADEGEPSDPDERRSEIEADPLWEVLTERPDGHGTVHRFQAPDRQPWSSLQLTTSSPNPTVQHLVLFVSSHCEYDHSSPIHPTICMSGVFLLICQPDG